MRLDVLQAHALGTSDFTQRAQLIEHVVHQFLRRGIDVPAAKADQVAETRVCSHRNPKGLGALDGAAHGARVAGVETGSDVGAADVAHQFVIDAVANRPRAKALTHVRVEIHCLHDRVSWHL